MAVSFEQLRDLDLQHLIQEQPVKLRRRCAP